MQGGQVTERINGRNNLVIQASWFDKAIAPMDNTMPNSVHTLACQKLSPGQPIQQALAGLARVGNGGCVLVCMVAGHKVQGRLAANAFDNSMRQAAPRLAIRSLDAGVKKLEF
jgi:hypothetical protein